MSVGCAHHTVYSLIADQILSVSVDITDGLPVGLQVMCWRLQEEKVLALVDAITQSLAATYSQIYT